MVMAGWYKQHTSELASLEAFARCGRADVLAAWLRVTRWTVDHESDELPEEMAAERVTLQDAGLLMTFADRCNGLTKHREATARWRERKATTTTPSVTSRDITEHHVTSRDNQDKTRQDKSSIEDRKENAAGSGDAGRSKRETRQQLVARFDAWTPSDETKAITKALGFSIEAERVLIRDWLLSTQKPWKGNFDAGVRNWARRNAPKQAAPRPVVKGWDDGDTWLGIPKGGTR
jgi:hypothetical protein